MGSANVEDAWLAWLVIKVARSKNFAHHVSAATVRRERFAAVRGSWSLGFGNSPAFK
jgi:hypothetical protein